MQNSRSRVGLLLRLQHMLHRGVCSPLLTLLHRSSHAIHTGVDLLQPQLLSLFLFRQVLFMINLFPPLPISLTLPVFHFHLLSLSVAIPQWEKQRGFAHSSHCVGQKSIRCPSGVHVPHLHRSPGHPWPRTAVPCSCTGQGLPHSSSQEQVLLLAVSLT